MDDCTKINGWQEWICTNEGCRCSAPRTSPEGMEEVLAHAFYAGVAWAEARPAMTLREGLDLTGGIPSEVYVGIGRDHYGTQYEVAAAVSKSLCGEIERLWQRPADIHEQVLRRINAHGGLPKGVFEEVYSTAQLVGMALRVRDMEIKRLERELAVVRDEAGYCPTGAEPEVEKEEFDPPLDPGIADAVVVLRKNGVETFESCQGGVGHAYPVPTVRFHGNATQGVRALGVAMEHRLPVAELRRVWSIQDNEPTGPWWEMTFAMAPLDSPLSPS